MLLRGVGKLLARFAYILGIRTAITIDNLKNAYPELERSEIERIALASYLSLGSVFSEFVYLRFASAAKIAQQMHLRNPEVLHEASAKGRGVVLLSAHLCNWEWMAIGLGLQMEKPLSVIIKNQTGRFAERFLDRMRTRFGNQMINAGDVRAIYRQLKSEQWLAILADQSAPPASVRAIFFGRSVPSFEGPARIALRTRAPLLFLDCERNPDGSSTMTAKVIEYDDLEDASEDSVQKLTQRHVQALEACIRTNPSRWLWQHRRWKNAGA